MARGRRTVSRGAEVRAGAAEDQRDDPGQRGSRGATSGDLPRRPGQRLSGREAPMARDRQVRRVGTPEGHLQVQGEPDDAEDRRGRCCGTENSEVHLPEVLGAVGAERLPTPAAGEVRPASVERRRGSDGTTFAVCYSRAGSTTGGRRGGVFGASPAVPGRGGSAAEHRRSRTSRREGILDERGIACPDVPAREGARRACFSAAEPLGGRRSECSGVTRHGPIGGGSLGDGSVQRGGRRPRVGGMAGDGDARCRGQELLPDGHSSGIPREPGPVRCVDSGGGRTGGRNARELGRHPRRSGVFARGGGESTGPDPRSSLAHASGRREGADECRRCRQG